MGEDSYPELFKNGQDLTLISRQNFSPTIKHKSCLVLKEGYSWT